MKVIVDASMQQSQSKRIKDITECKNAMNKAPDVNQTMKIVTDDMTNHENSYVEH